MTQTFSPADRIRELSSINGDVSLMLKSAGLAINRLTGRAMQDEDDTEMTDGAATVESSKVAFEGHVTEYYTKLQAVTARLRRQAYALEEAGIISPEASSLASSARQDAASARGNPNGTSNPEASRITNGGLGNLDISWLNSRGNKVATEKENEIMNEVKEMLQEMVKRKKTDSSSDAG